MQETNRRYKFSPNLFLPAMFTSMIAYFESEQFDVELRPIGLGSIAIRKW